jgi:hypothetical protein
VDRPALDAFAAEHHGLLTKTAAARWGMSKATWFRCLGDGRLISVHPGVARLPGAPVTREQRIAAAALAAAPGGVASHRSAAYLWGVDRPEDDPIDVIVTRRTRTFELDGVIVHRPRDLQDLTPVLKQRIPTTNVLRLLCDLGAVDPRGVAAAVGHIVTSHLASPMALRNAIDRHGRSGRRGVPAFRRALEEWVIDGKPVDSKLESAMRRLFQRYRLPPYEFHAIAGPYEVDFLIVVPVRFTYHQVVWEHAKQARRIAGIIRRWAPGLDLGGLSLGFETEPTQTASAAANTRMDHVV